MLGSLVPSRLSVPHGFRHLPAGYQYQSLCGPKNPSRLSARWHFYRAPNSNYKYACSRLRPREVKRKHLFVCFQYFLHRFHDRSKLYGIKHF